jgi:hypothetical protein
MKAQAYINQAHCEVFAVSIALYQSLNLGSVHSAVPNRAKLTPDCPKSNLQGVLAGRLRSKVARCDIFRIADLLRYFDEVQFQIDIDLFETLGILCADDVINLDDYR